MPLNENNKVVIQEALTTSNRIEIPCLDMKSNSSSTFVIESVDGTYRLEIFNRRSCDKDIFYTGQTDLFLLVATNLLRERSLRLFSPEQPHQILDWQFGSR